MEYNFSPPSCSTPNVSEFAAGGTTPTRYIEPLNAPVALAVDPVGNLYVLDTDAAGSGRHINEYAPGRK